MTTRMPFSAYALLAMITLFAMLVVASLVIYLGDARLGYSYAVHSVIFFPLARDSVLATGVGMLAGACVAGAGYAVLKHRCARGLRVVPVWVMPVLVVVLALYIQQVLQIDLSWRPSEESAKALPAP